MSEEESWWNKRIKTKPLMQNKPPLQKVPENKSFDRLYEDGLMHMYNKKKYENEAKNEFKNEESWLKSDTPEAGRYNPSYSYIYPDPKTTNWKLQSRNHFFTDPIIKEKGQLPGAGHYDPPCRNPSSGAAMNKSDRAIELFRSTSTGQVFIDYSFVDRQRAEMIINATERNLGRQRKQSYIGPGTYEPSNKMAFSQPITEYK